MKIKKLNFNSCWYHPKRLGRYEVENKNETYFLCEPCYIKKMGDNSLLSEEGQTEFIFSDAIELQNNKPGITGERLFRTSSVAQIPSGKGKFSWETWGDFGTEPQKSLKKSLRKFNGKTLQDLQMEIFAQRAFLMLTLELSDDKVKMGYNKKDYILVDKEFLFTTDFVPYAHLGKNGIIDHIYNFKYIKGYNPFD